MPFQVSVIRHAAAPAASNTLVAGENPTAASREVADAVPPGRLQEQCDDEPRATSGSHKSTVNGGVCGPYNKVGDTRYRYVNGTYRDAAVLNRTALLIKHHRSAACQRNDLVWYSCDGDRLSIDHKSVDFCITRGTNAAVCVRASLDETSANSVPC